MLKPETRTPAIYIGLIWAILNGILGCQHTDQAIRGDSEYRVEVARLRGENERLKLKIDDLQTKILLMEGKSQTLGMGTFKPQGTEGWMDVPVGISRDSTRLSQGKLQQNPQPTAAPSAEKERATSFASASADVKSAQRLYKTALQELEKHKWKAAEKTLSELVQLHSTSEEADDAVHLKAYCMYQQQKYSDAYAIWSTMPGRYPDSPRILEGFYYMARIHERSGEYEDAKWLYEQIVQAQSKSRHQSRAKKSLAKLERRLGGK